MKGPSFNRLSDDVAGLLDIPNALRSFAMEALLEVPTFLEVEKAVIRSLLERVIGTAERIDAESLVSIVRQRQAAHWAASASVAEVQRKARHAVYEGLAAAAEFFALRNRYREGFDAATALDLYRAYENELYRFDQLYRHF